MVRTKREKEICSSFVVTPQTAKVMATVHDKTLVKMKKALNMYNKIIGKREKLHSHNFYYSILLQFYF